jgi:hypothetical protein
MLRQNPQSQHPIQLGVFGEIDFAHSAGTQLFAIRSGRRKKALLLKV